MEPEDRSTELDLHKAGTGGTLFDREPEPPRLTRWLEDEFYELERDESGNLNRRDMDYALREAGIEGRGELRILRRILRSMQAAARDEWKLRKPPRGSDRH